MGLFYKINLVLNRKVKVCKIKGLKVFFQSLG